MTVESDSEPSQVAVATSGMSVSLIDLTISVGNRVLLENANVHFEPGRVSLIVGCSGAGKSVLLRTLAGLIPKSDPVVKVKGKVACTSEDYVSKSNKNPIGIVFQNFALFDEFSALDNVRFAESHRSRGREDATATQLLDALEVPRSTPTSALSGGQKQRLAIARTLAFAPDVILYDEPTSGLDAITAHRVARMIGETHDRFPKTSIIVTHDYESLPGIADDIFLFDPNSRSLTKVPPDQWTNLPQLLQAPPIQKGESKPVSRLQRFAKSCQAGLGDFFDLTTRAAVAVAKSPLSVLPLWRSPKWGLRYLLHYLRLVAGPSAWAYVVVAGMIIGFVATYFTFKFLPYSSYTEPLLIENLLHSMGFALYRILVPVMTTILIAARSGAAVASDVGGKSYGNQLAAMRTLDANPQRYLLSTVLLAFLIGTPILLGISYVVATLTSLLAFIASHPDEGSIFWDMHYHRELRIPGQFLYAGTSWLVSKTLICAFGTAMVCYHRGVQPKRSTRDVSEGITSAILWSTLWVLAVQFVFSFIEFE
jgi:ABC-type transporter Mla maintaining outer membrane lipid asymmetry ATPase subunit MlaF/ABC-type transporter Mla maintaining outer membrane lipid asymmetry permease subunit MlaE